jgi:hypothetical protein
LLLSSHNEHLFSTNHYFSILQSMEISSFNNLDVEIGGFSQG